MSEKGYYQDNWIRRGWNKFVNAMRSLPDSQFNAISFAVGAFIVLIAFLEYKVFESVLGLTRDTILAASVLTVTAFGGVLAEIVLHRNKSATDDQLWAADTMFYVSLITSAVVGFGIWAQASGVGAVDLIWFSVSIPDYASMVFVVITAVTIVDVLLLRQYIRSDVDAVHKRNVARSESKKREADLKIDDSLIDFDAQVKLKSEGMLRIEARRKQIREELTKLYGGHVPPEVMAEAMRKLDEIKIELLTGEDINRDGVVGLPPAANRQPPNLQPARPFASETKAAQPTDPTKPSPK